MLTDGVLLIAESSIPHPVTDSLFGGRLAPTAEEIGPLNNYLLVIVDARQSSSAFGEGSLAQKALRAGVALLILSPAEGQLAPLATVIGAVPDAPAQAVFVCRNGNAGEDNRFEATVLACDPIRGERGFADNKDSEAAPQAKAEGLVADQPSCVCREDKTSYQETVVGSFTTLIQSRLSTGTSYAPTAVALPDGLKFFRSQYNFMSGFTSRATGDDGVDYKNGPGSLAGSLIVWGFLDQTATSNAQYLVVEASYNLNPGSLAQYDDEGRGFANTLLVSNIRPLPSEFAAIQHIPTNGVNSWDETLKLDINYKDPLSGSYQIYPFTANVNQTIVDWSVQNQSAGPRLGSQWFMNAPADGADLLNTYTNAFTTWGGVKSLPSASTGTLAVREASAWITKTVMTGRVGISTPVDMQSTIFYSFRCGLLVCYRIAVLARVYRFGQSLSVDFSAIQP